MSTEIPNFWELTPWSLELSVFFNNLVSPSSMSQRLRRQIPQTFRWLHKRLFSQYDPIICLFAVERRKRKSTFPLIWHEKPNFLPITARVRSEEQTRPVNMMVLGNHKRQSHDASWQRSLSAVTILFQYNYWLFLTNIICPIINGTPFSDP